MLAVVSKSLNSAPLTSRPALNLSHPSSLILSPKSFRNSSNVSLVSTNKVNNRNCDVKLCQDTISEHVIFITLISSDIENTKFISTNHLLSLIFNQLHGKFGVYG